ncbi:protein angel homolog 2 [Syngnathoides biaculeatus]|uniref:protein angel homolog 2 n=1 Tax=Syngnathoides biaculeatus TaxID=300417 RepID=UPI002ADDD67B|nr:protein angel homolog 2 [Syngnathoides biaculeatus]XP_061668842.1 protein angel homolog 2 [Syngnathoides biaculeatus]XP_061668843.1 protein angel homolog 2 [Syngnathoides biaculeatus]
MFLRHLSSVATSLFPQHLIVCRLGLVCFTPVPVLTSPSRLPAPTRTSPCRLFTSTGVMMEHSDREPPHKRMKNAEGKRSVKHGDANRGGGEKSNRGCTGSEFRARDANQPGRSQSRDVESGTAPSQRCGFKPERRTADEETSGGRPSGFLPQAETSSEVAGGEPPPPGMESAVDQAPMLGQERQLDRRWEMSPACSAAAPPLGGGRAFDFSVMSYNILSQELLHANSFLYRHCSAAALAWSHRLPNLLVELRKYDADVLCLQEVQEDHFENQIKPALQARGYECVYKKRTGKKPDGCVVAFKTSRLRLLSSNPVEFFRPGDALLDRDNVGLVVLLRPKDAAASSGFVCVANTHLLYNPRRGDVKLAQLAILLAEISHSSRPSNGSRNPVVLCGDFNSTPSSPLVAFLMAGRLQYRNLPISMVSGQEYGSRGQRLLDNPIWSPTLGINRQCQYESGSASAASSSPSSAPVEQEIDPLSVKDIAKRAAAKDASKSWSLEHDLTLRSSYTPWLMPDGRAAITTCHSRCAMMVDYILYTPLESLPGGRGLELLGRLSLVGQPELEQVGGLPNLRHPSDHLPLLARFRWHS